MLLSANRPVARTSQHLCSVVKGERGFSGVSRNPQLVFTVSQITICGTIPWGHDEALFKDHEAPVLLVHEPPLASFGLLRVGLFS